MKYPESILLVHLKPELWVYFTFFEFCKCFFNCASDFNLDFFLLIKFLIALGPVHSPLKQYTYIILAHYKVYVKPKTFLQLWMEWRRMRTSGFTVTQGPVREISRCLLSCQTQFRTRTCRNIQ